MSNLKYALLLLADIYFHAIIQSLLGNNRSCTAITANGFEWCFYLDFGLKLGYFNVATTLGTID